MNQSKFTARLWARFFSQVEITPKCWNWKGPLNKGYAKFTVKRTTVIGSRFIYERLIGDIPPGLVIDHTCFNPACVNPTHLEAVTQKVNLHRSDTFQARNAKKTHCPRGHPYAGTNLILRPDGGRACRECGRQVKERRRRREGRQVRGPYHGSVANQKAIAAGIPGPKKCLRVSGE